MSRYLVVGDPVVTLGDEAFIEDGALIIEDRSIVEAGSRSELDSKGAFARVLGSPHNADDGGMWERYGWNAAASRD